MQKSLNRLPKFKKKTVGVEPMKSSRPFHDQMLTSAAQKQSVHQARYDVWLQNSMDACFQVFLALPLRTKTNIPQANLPGLCRACHKKTLMKEGLRHGISGTIRGIVASALPSLCVLSILWSCGTQKGFPQPPFEKGTALTEFFKKKERRSLS